MKRGKQIGATALIRHKVRYMTRWPLGTSYPDIVASVRGLMPQLPPMRDPPRLWIDGTGVGRPIADLFREIRVDCVAVSITGGDDVRRVGPGEIRIPKRLLASLIQSVMQTGRLEIVRELPLSRTLEDELSSFRVKISAGGSETFEGRSGIHDDLVLGLALAVWAAEKGNDAPGLACLELARRELEQLRGGPVEEVRPENCFQPVSAAWFQQQAELKP